jgi:23S rRNA (pseudouridine1915-N3)-methyltransferase
VKIQIRAVGKMRDRGLDALCQEYVARTSKHVPMEVREVRDDADLTRTLPAGAQVIALEAGGEAWSTPVFCQFLSKHMLQGTRAIVFLIGGADGLMPATVSRSHKRLSLSPLTLPHRLARVILCEQVYRCVSSLRGEPYNR